MEVGEHIANSMRRLRVLIALASSSETECLRAHLQDQGHSVALVDCHTLFNGLAADTDVLICDDRWNRPNREDGRWLAEQCRAVNEVRPGRLRVQVILLISSGDWFHFLSARRTGAHVIVRPTRIGALLRYLDLVAEQLIDDRVLGPMLIGMHSRRATNSEIGCNSCEWIGCSLLYGTSEVDIPLSRNRSAVLNALMLRRRGQSLEQISNAIGSHHLLSKLAFRRTLRSRSIKMEISRIRNSIDGGLRQLGAPYTSIEFLPKPGYGHEQYRLTGNWQLVHLSADPF